MIGRPSVVRSILSHVLIADQISGQRSAAWPGEVDGTPAGGLNQSFDFPKERD